MNKRIIISLGLLVILSAAAVLINFDKPVDAAYLAGVAGQWSNNGNYIFYNTDNVGIGTSTPSYKLAVVGDVAANSFMYNSDSRLKKDIVRLDNSLNKINNLEGVSFTWKDNNKKEIGLIAQDVERIVPELVVTGNDGIKAVKYGNIVALLIEAVKEQQIEIDALKLQVADLSK